jgi:membrane associated rhomboid family serine protease
MMRDLPPRRRSQAPAWTRPITERLTPAVKALVLIQTVLFLFYVMVREIRPVFEAHLALGPGMLHGEIWQPLTALFVHFNPLGFIMNLVGLWFVGAFIERTNGTRRFLQLFFTSGIAAFVAMGLVARLKPYGLGEGCSYAVLALFVAFGKMYDRAPAQILGGFVMQARHLAMLFVGFSVMMDVARADWASLAATLVSSGVGYVMSGGKFGGLLALLRIRRGRRRYQVLDGGQAPTRATTKKKSQYWN